MKNKGFTLIELLVCLVIVGILACIFIPKLTNYNGDGTICRGGYKFTNDYRHSVQVLDDQGHGIRCEMNH